MNYTAPKLISLYQNDFGKNLLEFESETINRYCEGFYGNTALSLGLPPINIRENLISGNWFIDSRYADFININKELLIKENCELKSQSPKKESNSALSPTKSKNLVVNLNVTELPFQNRSIDLIIGNHILDCEKNPENICREFARVLSAEGVLIITMFNPKSLIGITQNTKWIRQELSEGWGKLNSRRISEWLKVLGLEVSQARFGIYLPAWQNSPKYISAKYMPTLIRQLNFIGDRWFANYGAVFIIMARKRMFKPATVGFKKNKILIKPSPATASVINANLLISDKQY